MENGRAVSYPTSPQHLLRNKGKQPILPKPLTIRERSELPQPGFADRTQPLTKRTESEMVSPSSHLKEKGKEPLLPHISPRDKTLPPERSPHAACLMEAKGMLGPKPSMHTSYTLIKPKDEPFTDGLQQFEVPITVIHPEPLSKDNSTNQDASIREANGPGSLASQSIDREDGNDGIPDPLKEKTANCDLANIVDESSANMELASLPSGEGTIDVRPGVDLVKQSRALDPLDPIGKPFSPNGSANVQSAADADQSQTDKHTNERGYEIDGNKELNGPEHEKSRSLLVVQQHQPTDEYVRSLHDVNDIAKGHEKVVISLVNEVNNEGLPSFIYIPENVIFQNAYVNFSLARIGENCCSICVGDCLSSSIPCACAHETGGDFAYTPEGLVKEDLLEECISMNRDPQKNCLFYCKDCPLERSKNDDLPEPCKGHLVRKFIKECWWKCGCGKQCGNRVVQRGINRELQVFMTPEGKGWGLRTLEDLPKGSFVCEYVGEILTNAELFERISQRPTNEEHAYPVLLDADWGSEGVLKDEEALCLDATHYGNVARFINHRCFDSNLVEIPVEVETPDHHYYHLAFFTTKKVKALEELTWDYGIDFDDQDHPVKAFKCRCGSKFCRNIKRSSRSRSGTRR
ncbi:Histone-lysine N-methyltransferase [Bertholletia excelsa]